MYFDNFIGRENTKGICSDEEYLNNIVYSEYNVIKSILISKYNYDVYNGYDFNAKEVIKESYSVDSKEAKYENE